MRKILVIEDEIPVRENILELLSAEGYSTIGAKDGEDGVRQARETLPDLILCDIMMSNLDGFGVLATLRKETRTITIPFIFLTALKDRNDIRKGMRFGADDFITKPFTREELLDAVRVRLEKQQIMIDQVQKKMMGLRENILHSLPHELLTPLSVVLGFSEIIIDGLENMSIAQIREMAEDIHNAGLAIMRLVQNQMLLTELDLIISDQEKIKDLRKNEIPSAAKIIAEIGHLKAKQEGREAQFHLSVEETSLKISETSLQKIVEEILDNAFRYSSAGTPVLVTGKKVGDHGGYRLEVTDKGQGMGIHQIRAIEFGLQDPQSKYDQQGIGIGLLIVQRIIGIYDGTLKITSTIGIGTTVEVDFKL